MVLSGHIAKLFERVLLKRLLRVARGVDEAQAVTNAPVDCRCQLHLLYDIILANSGRVWLMALDITRGFPSTSRALTVTALRRRLLNMKPENQVEQLLAALKRFPTNEELVAITASKG